MVDGGRGALWWRGLNSMCDDFAGPSRCTWEQCTLLQLASVVGPDARVPERQVQEELAGQGGQGRPVTGPIYGQDVGGGKSRCAARGMSIWARRAAQQSG